MAFCSNCGVEIREEQVFCNQCGAPTGRKQVAASMAGVPYGVSPHAQVQLQAKSRVTAGLLAILIGGVGAHKFYLGQNIDGFPIGVIYLLTCITGIPAIISLIEGIIYLTKSDQDFYQQYVVGKKQMF